MPLGRAHRWLGPLLANRWRCGAACAVAPPLPSSSVWGTGSDGAAIGEAWRSACSTSGRDNSAGRRSAASGISDSNSSSSTSSCSAGGGSFEAASLVRGCQQRRLRPWHAPTQLSALQAAGARAASSLSNVIAAEQGKTRLQGYLPAGFILNNTQVEGPVLCLPELWLMWDVGGLGDVTLESLAILDLMAPPPEVLVVGCGARVRRLPDELLTQLAERGVAVEALDTRNAISTFNFLNDEGRVVVGALLPCNEE